MKEALRAAREEVALKRQVEAIKELSGEEKARELDSLSGPARYPEVNALLQKEMIADILEDLAGAGESEEPEKSDDSDDTPDLLFLSNEQVFALNDAGVGNWKDLRDWRDEDLEEVPHIGKATVKKIRDALGPPTVASNSEESDEAGESDSDEGNDDAPDFSFLTEEQAEALHDAGYTNPDEMREASDEDLVAVNGVGPATVAKIRDALREDAAPEEGDAVAGSETP